MLNLIDNNPRTRTGRVRQHTAIIAEEFSEQLAAVVLTTAVDGTQSSYMSGNTSTLGVRPSSLSLTWAYCSSVPTIDGQTDDCFTAHAVATAALTNYILTPPSPASQTYSLRPRGHTYSLHIGQNFQIFENCYYQVFFNTKTVSGLYRLFCFHKIVHYLGDCPRGLSRGDFVLVSNRWTRDRKITLQTVRRRGKGGLLPSKF